MDYSERYGQPQKHGHYERALSRFGPPGGPQRGGPQRPASAGGRAGYTRAARQTSALVATARVTRRGQSAVGDRRSVAGRGEESPGGASPLQQLKQHHKELALHQHHEQQQHHRAAETLQRHARGRIARDTYKGSIGAEEKHYQAGQYGAWA